MKPGVGVRTFEPRPRIHTEVTNEFGGRNGEIGPRPAESVGGVSDGLRSLSDLICYIRRTDSKLYGCPFPIYREASLPVVVSHWRTDGRVSLLYLLRTYMQHIRFHELIHNRSRTMRAFQVHTYLVLCSTPESFGNVGPSTSTATHCQNCLVFIHREM